MELLQEQDSMHPKQEEFIDHSLLPPEYIRDSNNFIMDFMDAPLIHTKSLNTTNSTSLEYHDKDVLNLQNSIYQFVQKHVNESLQDAENALTTTNAASHAPTSNSLPPMQKKTKYGMLTVHMRKPRKSRVKPKKNDNVAGEEFPAVPNVSQSNQLVQTGNSVSRQVARKALPHKKRISRKLALSEADTNDALLNRPRMPFICEICDYTTSSQIEFYTHLKEHYEPETSGTILATMKTSLDSIDVNKSCTVLAKEAHDKFPDVLQDVHMTYNNFDDARDDAVHKISKSATQIVSAANDALLENSLVAGSAMDASHCKQNTDDTLEFSDTEDMLEGIRNVVDKVSIEDTCDNIDLIETNCMRTQWFSNNNTFNDGEESFTGQLRNLLSGDADALNEQNDCLDNVISEAANEQEHEFVPVLEKANPSIEQMNKLYEQESEFYENAEIPKSDNEKQQEEQTKDELKNNSKKYSCSKCNRDFKSNNALKYHIRTHSGIRPHKCAICNLSFVAKGALKAHLTTHTSAKPFECDHCERKFRRWSDLNCHIISIHSNEKPHQCEFCGKSFSRRYSLILHRRIHTSERNYKCEFCGKGFRASIYLDNHRKVHTGERPHTCNICSKSFRLSSDIRRHERMHARKAAKQKEHQQQKEQEEQETASDNTSS